MTIKHGCVSNWTPAAHFNHQRTDRARLSYMNEVETHSCQLFYHTLEYKKSNWKSITIYTQYNLGGFVFLFLISRFKYKMWMLSDCTVGTRLRSVYFNMLHVMLVCIHTSPQLRWKCSFYSKIYQSCTYGLIEKCLIPCFDTCASASSSRCKRLIPEGSRRKKRRRRLVFFLFCTCFKDTVHHFCPSHSYSPRLLRHGIRRW